MSRYTINLIQGPDEGDWTFRVRPDKSELPGHIFNLPQDVGITYDLVVLEAQQLVEPGAKLTVSKEVHDLLNRRGFDRKLAVQQLTESLRRQLHQVNHKISVKHAKEVARNLVEMLPMLGRRI